MSSRSCNICSHPLTNIWLGISTIPAATGTFLEKTLRTTFSRDSEPSKWPTQWQASSWISWSQMSHLTRHKPLRTLITCAISKVTKWLARAWIVCYGMKFSANTNRFPRLLNLTSYTIPKLYSFQLKVVTPSCSLSTAPFGLKTNRPSLKF